MHKQKLLTRFLAVAGLALTGHIAVLAYNSGVENSRPEFVTPTSVEDALKDVTVGSNKLEAVKRATEVADASLPVEVGATTDAESVEYYYNYIPRTKSDRSEYAWNKLAPAHEGKQTVASNGATEIVAKKLEVAQLEQIAGTSSQQCTSSDCGAINRSDDAVNVTMASNAIPQGQTPAYKDETYVVADNSTTPSLEKSDVGPFNSPLPSVQDTVAKLSESIQTASAEPSVKEDATDSKRRPRMSTQMYDRVSEVPVPAALPLMASAMVAFGVGSRRTKRK